VIARSIAVASPTTHHGARVASKVRPGARRRTRTSARSSSAGKDWSSRSAIACLLSGWKRTIWLSGRLLDEVKAASAVRATRLDELMRLYGDAVDQVEGADPEDLLTLDGLETGCSGSIPHRTALPPLPTTYGSCGRVCGHSSATPHGAATDCGMPAPSPAQRQDLQLRLES
jgi:hypothetical protein